MEIKKYFEKLSSLQHKKYEALKAFFYNNLKAEDVATKFGYSVSSIYSMIRDFKKFFKENPDKDPFFIQSKKGRPLKKKNENLHNIIINMRKKNLSSPDIKSILDTLEYNISERTITNILRREGFSRLPRRTKNERARKELININAPKSMSLDYSNEKFFTTDIGILCFLPLIKFYGLDKIIINSDFPETKTINKFSSIMSFLALKLSNIRRYTADDLWCMNRGLGLFAGLNVLPKADWFTSYSNRVTRKMNRSFLKELHKIWIENGLLGDTANLDFTTIPYWGDGSHLEKNWSGKRRHSLASMLTVLAQDPDTGLIDYGDTDILHKNEHAVVLEFLDFYMQGNQDNNLKYLVFDSKFTTYYNLSKLDDKGIKFVTIRRRGKNIVKSIEKIPKKEWKKVRVVCAGNKTRNLKINDKIIKLKKYGKNIRQIAITGHGKIKPALIITNDFELEVDKIIRKYTRRWIVEKSISEQIEFFHLNRVSSSMVIKVDFDLTMTILAHNLYRLFSIESERYENYTDVRIYEKFIKNAGDVEIEKEEIKLYLKKKRALPTILTLMKYFENVKYPWMNNKKLNFFGATRN